MSLYSELPQPKNAASTEDETLEARTNAKASSSSALYSDLSNPTVTSSPTGASMTTSSSSSATAPGWSAITMFKPIIRKPSIQAKPKLNRPTPTAISQGIPPAIASTTLPQQQELPGATKGHNNSLGTSTAPALSDKPHPKSLSSNEDVNGFMAVQQNLKKEKKKRKGKQKDGPAPLNLQEEYDPFRPNDYFEFKAYEQKRKDEMAAEKEAIRKKQRYGNSRSRSRSRSTSSRSRSASYASSRSYSRSRSESKSRSRSRSRSLSMEREGRPYSNQFAPPSSFHAEDRQEVSSFSGQAIEQSRPISIAAITSVESGEDAWMRRAQLSGRVPIPPARSPSPPPQHHTVGSLPQSTHGDDFAKRLMTKYGWQEGKGLGKSGDGIREALSVQQTGRGSGIIVNNAPAFPTVSPKVAAQVSPTTIRSTVILLTNMVGPGEVDDLLQSETADECSKFGKVERCLVFEVPNGKLPPEDSVRIFVQFASQDSAEKAITFLNGRYFGGRVVRASFYDLERFERLDLAPTMAEMKA